MANREYYLSMQAHHTRFYDLVYDHYARDRKDPAYLTVAQLDEALWQNFCEYVTLLYEYDLHQRQVPEGEEELNWMQYALQRVNVLLVRCRYMFGKHKLTYALKKRRKQKLIEIKRRVKRCLRQMR